MLQSVDAAHRTPALCRALCVRRLCEHGDQGVSPSDLSAHVIFDPLGAGSSRLGVQFV